MIISRIILSIWRSGAALEAVWDPLFGGPNRHDLEDVGDVLRRILIVFSEHFMHTKYDF